jgi:trehalose/maltose transport system substrate-binding protein
MMRARTLLIPFIFASLIGLILFFFSDRGSQKKNHDVSIACDSLGKKKAQCVASVKDFEKETGLKVKIVEAPTGSSTRLAWVQRLLASQSSNIDVYQIDTTWAGLLKNHLIPLSIYLTEEEKSLYHPSLIQNNTIDGELLALPWYVDIGLMIYRKDLLEKYKKTVPQTWQELIETAHEIQNKERASGNGGIWGFVFTAKAFEGLTCNALEWIHSSKDQALIDTNGNVKINTPQNIQSLSQIADCIGKITPKGVLNYAEEDSRGVFQSGNAVFVRHWPYVISLAEAEESPLKGKIGVTSLPRGLSKEDFPVSTLGGWQLAVSKYSKNKEAAVKLTKFLTSKNQLKKRALRGGYYPPMPSLYQDPKVQEALPAWHEFQKAFENVIARPSAQTKSKYNQVSSQFWNTVHSILIGKKKAKEALENLEKKLNTLLKKG